MLKSYKKIFFKRCKSRRKNLQNNVDKNTLIKPKLEMIVLKLVIIIITSLVIN